MYICSIGTGVNVGFPGASTLANSTLVSLEGAQARRFFGLLMPVLLAADGYAVYAYPKDGQVGRSARYGTTYCCWYVCWLPSAW